MEISSYLFFIGVPAYILFFGIATEKISKKYDKKIFILVSLIGICIEDISLVYLLEISFLESSFLSTISSIPMLSLIYRNSKLRESNYELYDPYAGLFTGFLLSIVVFVIIYFFIALSYGGV